MNFEIEGLKGFKTETVSLDEFFELSAVPKEVAAGEETPATGEGTIKVKKEPVYWVKVRPLPPFTTAEIEELTYQNVKVHADKSTNFAVPADTRMLVRKKKLGYGIGVAGHNIKNKMNGEVIAWNEDLWKYLDSVNPAILRKVVKAIDQINSITEGEENPTSGPVK